MAWTAPQTWQSTPHVLTAAEFNEQIRDNEDYLKTEVDKLPTVSQTVTAKAVDTVYQNTSGKIRMVTVSLILTMDAVNTPYATVYVEAANPPTIVVAQIFQGIANQAEKMTITFIVPPDWYYKITKTVAGTSAVVVGYWTEWDLH